jgi:hypothetical protein
MAKVSLPEAKVIGVRMLEEVFEVEPTSFRRVVVNGMEE